MKLIKPIVFFDLETTGVDKSTDRIVEISMVKIFNDEQEIKTTKVNQLIPIPAGATEVHGISNDDVKYAPPFRKIAKSILEFISACDIAGYNSNSFDVPLLYNEFHRAGIVWNYSGVNFIDIGNIFKRKNERTLSAAYKHYLGNELENAHSAEADILATYEVFKAQLKVHEDLPADMNELAKYSNFDRELIDLGGCFAKDADGDYIFNFGKHKGAKCKDNLSYISWMSGQSFLPDALGICEKLLSKQFS